MTVELSMYPFHENYRDLIQGFIHKLNDCDGLAITEGPTSTNVVGEYSLVMKSQTDLMAWSHAEHGRAVFVAKFLPGYDGIQFA